MKSKDKPASLNLIMQLLCKWKAAINLKIINLQNQMNKAFRSDGTGNEISVGRNVFRIFSKPSEYIGSNDRVNNDEH
jgi:hypothetical protein